MGNTSASAADQEKATSLREKFKSEGMRLATTYYNEAPEVVNGILNFTSCFPPTVRRSCVLLNQHLKPLDKLSSEIRKLAIDLRVDEHLKRLKELSMQTLEQEYWDQHKPEYIARINAMIKQLPQEEVKELNESVQIVVIPAMNETNLDKTLEVLDGSLYPTKLDKKFDKVIKPIEVVVYFNHKESPEDVPEEVQQSLRMAQKKYKNIRLHIVRERVPPDNTVQDSKKVALDLALMAKGNGRDIPILMLDADISEISHGTIRKTTRALNINPWLPRAISTDYDIPRSLLRDHPAMYYYLKIYDAVEEVGMLESPAMIQKIYGGFVLSMAKVYLAAGGLVPYRNTFEDSLFMQQLLCLMNGNLDTLAFVPINSVKEFDETAQIAPNHLREIAAVTGGESAYVRWGSIYETQRQNVEAGSIRKSTIENTHPLLRRYDTKQELYQVLETAIIYFLENEYKDSFHDYGVQAVVFNVFVKIAENAGLSRTSINEIWEKISPMFHENMIKGKLISMSI
ncbi:hypothetical protein IT418_03525 [bacterium]|nr:hypothetical protein [bacterium]